MDIDTEVDHYAVLALPTGEEGAKLSEREIKKAYRLKALELHPDKRLDPNAHENFQRIKTSYEILQDKKARAIFDDLLRAKREKFMRQLQQNSKRRKMMSDLEERERAAFAFYSNAKGEGELEKISRRLSEQIARIRNMHADRATSATSTLKKRTASGENESSSSGDVGLDKQKVLKVFWKKAGEDYSAQRLRELFQNFGEVEDVVITKSTKKKGSALAEMASKDAAVTATSSVLGDLNNPLLVLPLQPVATATFPSAQQPAVSETPELSRFNGAEFQTFEDSVLTKLRKGAGRQQ